LFSSLLDNIITIVVVFVCVLGPSLVIASVGHAAVTALGRNPSAAPKVLVAMLLAFLYVEAIALVALLVAFQIFS
jgi:F0F1-type ATP synthase membrane subunit c/vacuolar-type H+-ATPase subunit K